MTCPISAAMTKAIFDAMDITDGLDQSAAARYAEAAFAATPLATILPAMIHIQDAIAERLHPSSPMTDAEFIDAVIAAADDREVVRAVREAKAADASPER